VTATNSLKGGEIDGFDVRMGPLAPDGLSGASPAAQFAEPSAATAPAATCKAVRRVISSMRHLVAGRIGAFVERDDYVTETLAVPWRRSRCGHVPRRRYVSTRDRSLPSDGTGEHSRV
jgi:hypothetical protein